MPRLLVALVVAILAGLALARGADVAWLRRLELATLDLRFQFRGPLEPAPELAIVAIDEASVVRFGRWPPPRIEIAAGLRRLADAKAAMAVVALQFTEPAAAIPSELRRLLTAAETALPPEAAALEAELAEAMDRPDPDRAMAEVFEAIPTVLAWTLAGEATRLPLDPRRVGTLAKAAFPTVLDPDHAIATPQSIAATSLGSSLDAALTPAPVLGDAASGLGHAWILLDADGASRFDLPALGIEGRLYPSLAAEAVRLYARSPRIETSVTLGRSVRLARNVGVEVDGRMRQLLNALGPPGTIPTYSFADLHAGAIDPGKLVGRIVVIGSSASGTADRFSMPFAPRATGAEHVATAIDNLVAGRSLRRDAPVIALDVLGAWLLAALGATFGGRRSLGLSTAVLVVLLLGWAGLAQWSFTTLNVWQAVAVPAAAALGAVGAVEAIRQARDQRRRRAVEQERRNLSRYFPPTVVEKLAGNDRPRAFDHTQDVAVMFLDVVGFTRMSEQMAPDATMDLLRQLHTRVEQAVFAHRGTLANFMGDGAMTVFGVPDPGPTDAADALRAARDLIGGIEAWSAERAARGETPIRVSCGIHYGPVLMGDIGGASQFQFTTIGDTVNVASRLEAMTRSKDAKLIASDSVVQAALRVDPLAAAGLEPLEPVPIRGREGALTIWRLKLDAA